MERFIVTQTFANKRETIIKVFLGPVAMFLRSDRVSLWFALLSERIVKPRGPLAGP